MRYYGSWVAGVVALWVTAAAVGAQGAMKAEIGDNAVVTPGDLGDAAATDKLFKDAETAATSAAVAAG